MVSLEKHIEAVNFFNGEIYKINGAGGPLHVAIDDGNLEDDTLEFCNMTIVLEKDPILFHLCRSMLSLLWELSPAQRWQWWLGSSIDAIKSAEGCDIEPSDNGYVICGKWNRRDRGKL